MEWLSYTLTDALTVATGSSDFDDDGLDDALEDELAFIVSPMFFFDEDEKCGEGPWRARPFFQVRPISVDGNLVEDWMPSTDPEDLKSVRVIYFVNYPTDCGAGDHVGDGERVEYILASHNLQTWWITQATYNQHGGEASIFGHWLAARVVDLNDQASTDEYFPYVAVAENKHAAYFGPLFRVLQNGVIVAADTLDSDACGGDAFFRQDHCFDETLFEDFDAGRHSYFQNWASFPTRNIGEPTGPLGGGTFIIDAESPGAPVKAVARPGGVVYGTTMTVSAQAFNVTEWWGGAVPQDEALFCGWMCYDSDRDADGDCDVTVFYGSEQQTLEGCSTSLSEKVEDRPATLPGGLSSALLANQTKCSEISCGGWWNACACDELCATASDCCGDFVEACAATVVELDLDTCADKCGERTGYVGGPVGCGCDFECTGRDDCCSDFQVHCPNQPPSLVFAGSCAGRCGPVDGLAANDCRCDDDCERRNDCCTDKDSVCGAAISRVPNSCQNACGGYGGACACDAACLSRLDCCSDYAALCDQSSGWPDTVDLFGTSSYVSEFTGCGADPKLCRTYEVMRGWNGN